MMRNEDN